MPSRKRLVTNAALALLLGGIALHPARGGELEDTCAALSKDEFEVVTLTVLYEHWTVEHAVAVHPEDLRKDHTYQFVSRWDLIPAPGPAVSDFLRHVRGEDFVPGDAQRMDCSWAFIVSDTAGHERLVIYADSTLSRAFVNGTFFKPGQPFKDWVRGKFHDAFELGTSLDH